MLGILAFAKGVKPLIFRSVVEGFIQVKLCEQDWCGNREFNSDKKVRTLPYYALYYSHKICGAYGNCIHDPSLDRRVL